MAFEDIEPHDGPRFPAIDPRQYWLDDFEETGYGGYYHVAGSFVAYLLGRFGPELFLAFHRNIHDGATLNKQNLETAFRDVYSRDLNDTIDEYLYNRECPFDASAIPLPYACTSSTLAWPEDGVWRFGGSLSPNTTGVIGGVVEEKWSLRSSVTLAIATEADYRISMFGTDAVGILARCGPCPWLETDVLIEPGAIRTVRLQPGLYSLTVVAEGVSLDSVYAQTSIEQLPGT